MFASGPSGAADVVDSNMAFSISAASERRTGEEELPDRAKIVLGAPSAVQAVGPARPTALLPACTDAADVAARAVPEAAGADTAFPVKKRLKVPQAGRTSPRVEVPECVPCGPKEAIALFDGQFKHGNGVRPT